MSLLLLTAADWVGGTDVGRGRVGGHTGVSHDCAVALSSGDGAAVARRRRAVCHVCRPRLGEGAQIPNLAWKLQAIQGQKPLMRRERSVATQQLAAHRMLPVSVDCSSSLGQTIGSRWSSSIWCGSCSQGLRLGSQSMSWFAMHRVSKVHLKLNLNPCLRQAYLYSSVTKSCPFSGVHENQKHCTLARQSASTHRQRLHFICCLGTAHPMHMSTARSAA